MQRKLIVFGALVSAAILLLAGAGCAKLKARDNLNKGVAAYKSARYADAVEYFKTSVSIEPTYINARLYLATAYMSQYIPGAESPENAVKERTRFFASSEIVSYAKDVDRWITES